MFIILIYVLVSDWLSGP